MRAVIDSTILIDYLAGSEAARCEISRYGKPCISMISWMEVMVGARDDAEASSLRDFLSGFEMMEVTMEVAERAVELRRDRRLRLPDAIIWATARCAGCLLVTRNTGDFPEDEPDVRVPYRSPRAR